MVFEFDYLETFRDSWCITFQEFLGFFAFSLIFSSSSVLFRILRDFLRFFVTSRNLLELFFSNFSEFFQTDRDLFGTSVLSSKPFGIFRDLSGTFMSEE